MSNKKIGIDWFQSASSSSEGLPYPGCEERAALVEFARVTGFSRGMLDAGNPLIMDGHTIAELALEIDRIHVASGEGLREFKPKDLQWLFEFNRAACPYHAGGEADGVEAHSCEEMIKQRPVAIVGRDLFLGFNARAKERIVALARSPHDIAPITASLLWGHLYSNCTADARDPVMSPTKAHRKQARRRRS